MPKLGAPLHPSATATAAAAATIDAEGAFAPVVAAVVGVMRQAWRHRPWSEMRPALRRLRASLQTGAIGLAFRFAGRLGGGVAANDSACSDEARHHGDTHGLLLENWLPRWRRNEPHPPMSSAPIGNRGAGRDDNASGFAQPSGPADRAAPEPRGGIYSGVQRRLSAWSAGSHSRPVPCRAATVLRLPAMVGHRRRDRQLSAHSTSREAVGFRLFTAVTAKGHGW